ncbi:MAG: KAP family NTPase [Oscillatoria princeps RMCB-10]|jgi:hypothetical protein|nr:KAP family NTPase [Oscillatoria princeps RMCB-10]
MDSSAVSPIEALNAAIKSENPFGKTGIVKEQDVWGKGFPDVSALNKYASDAVFQAIEQVRTSQSSQEKVISLALTAQQGVGKTHVLSRLRHRLESEGGGLFVYASADKYTDLNQIKYQFQQTLADSLRHTGSQGVMQWQEVAAAMANEGFKAINPGAPNLSPQELVSRFDKVYASWVSKSKNLMNTLSQKVSQTKPHADPYTVRAILWTLSETQAPFAIRWLSGEELDTSKAEELGLPANAGKTNQDREAEALNKVQQILNLVSAYNPVIICFDEIDVKNNTTDEGLPTEMVLADLVKRLYDTLHQSDGSQGIIIVTVMLPVTWTQKIKVMSGGTPDRISTYTKGKPVELNFLDSNSILELVTLWLKEFFYERKNLTPPTPIYPFEESQLREYGKVKPTVREALAWCAENFKVYMPPLPENPVERFELAITRELEADLGDYLEDNALIASALEFGFKTLKGQTLEGVTIEDVITEVKPKAQNKGWINFKVSGTDNGRVVKIGVAVIQSNQVGLVAGLRRLNDCEMFDLTRGCLVRSKSKVEKIKKNSEAGKLLDQLISEKGGEHVDLREEDIWPLIAVHSVYQKRGDYDLTEEQVFDLIAEKQLTFDSLLLREILSAPSGTMPAVDEQDERQLLDDFLNPSSMDTTDDLADLTDLFS